VLEVRAYRDSDWDEWLRMNVALFPEYAPEELAKGMQEGSLAGFVEAGSRPYADGCDTSPVGYVEAWYVDDDLRRQGYGRALLEAAENWARGQGYLEMASDALLDNHTSHAAHRASGYEEVERIVQFRKVLAR
jgi:aminoglycoside 6'-N-acetyltransferase I